MLSFVLWAALRMANLMELSVRRYRVHLGAG